MSSQCSSACTTRLRPSRPYTKCSTMSRDICARAGGSSGRYPMQTSYCTSVSSLEFPPPPPFCPPSCSVLTDAAADRAELEKIPEHAPLEFGNNVYRIKFDTRHRPSMDYYGHRYHFYLQDAVEHVPEFVVYWPNFERCVCLTVALAQSSSHFGLPTVYIQHRKTAQPPSPVQTRFSPYLS